MSTSGTPGSELGEFARALDVICGLLERVPAERFRSPFTAAGLAPQLLGLTDPLEGSGDSPFSLASIALELRGCGPELARLAESSVGLRRAINDDIQDMIVPALLGEQDRYIELLASTRYREHLSESGGEADFRAATRAKFELLERLISRTRPGRHMCAHIGHFGFEQDIVQEDPFLRDLDADDRERWYELSFPFAVEVRFRGFPAVEGQATEARGWMIMIPNSAEQLLTSRRLRARKLQDAATLAAKLGARTVGMAGLVASFAEGGHRLANAFPQLGFTTGHAYTIANIIDVTAAAIERVGLPIERATLAVVGAAGSIGSGCVRLAARQLRPRRMILSDTSPFVADSLAQLRAEVKSVQPDVKLAICSENELVREAEVVIVATNAAESVLDESHFKPGAIVVDDSFPKNVPRSVIRSRADVVLLEGGLVQLPYSVDVAGSRNFQDTVDAPLTRMLSCKQVYGCLAETVVLALRGHEGSYGLGASNLDLAREVFGWGRASGFSRAALQAFDLAVPDERFRAVRAALRARGLSTEG